MLTEVILACDGKKPQKIEFDQIFTYNGKKNFKKMKSFSAKADTNSMSLAYLGDVFPGLQILRLNNSIIPSIRDLCSQFNNLRVLSLENCGLTCLDGIATVSPKVQELYLGHNQIDNVSELLGLNSLKLLNLEHNLIPYVEDVEILKCCRSLKKLILRGNGAAEHPEYRTEIKRLIPKLKWLDEVRFGHENDDQQEDSVQPEEPAEQPESAREPLKPLDPLPKLNSTEKIPIGRPMTRPRQKIIKPLQSRAPMRQVKIWHNVGSIRL